MPLTRLKEEYLEQDGVRFLMEDESGSTVLQGKPRSTARSCRPHAFFPVPTALFSTRTAS